MCLGVSLFLYWKRMTIYIAQLLILMEPAFPAIIYDTGIILRVQVPKVLFLKY